VSRKPALLAVLLVSSALAGCERGGAEQGWATEEPTRFCTDASGKRVADQECERPRSGGGVSPFLWYYLGSLQGRNRYTIPAVGAVARGGGIAPSPGINYSSSDRSFMVTRGGFGRFGGVFGGHGE
jgi:hypothetical protein